ncbi:MAG: PfkB family carbohydrate kinase [Candidatus Omnitrophica bacterium]|nr:bifunctional hydroxymethylpyrimidine kinase/phosphomethylpyrimidine kinase [Candidatus Omnitrophota bacterium]MCG2706567.1 PfkB family carbohydrate kinase [Candidatus Omnitrophota bacterium]
MSIIVLGTVALDTVKTPFGLRRHILGGSAVHFAIVCRLFTKVNLVAVVGEDFPSRYIKFLHQKGIVLTSLIRTEGATFKWGGQYKGDLNTAITLSTELGVLLTFRPRVSEEQKNIKHIFLANLDPDIQNHLLTHMRSPHLVALDSMNYWIKHKRRSLLRLLKKVDIYVANDQEARTLSGESNLLKAAKYLRLLGPEMILIKKGEHGVLFFSDRFIFSIPAYPTDRVIDPTGAGDTFAGAFMGYLTKVNKINEASIKKAIIYGTIAASFNVEDFGLNKTSRLERKDLQQRLREFRKYVLF